MRTNLCLVNSKLTADHHQLVSCPFCWTNRQTLSNLPLRIQVGDRLVVWGWNRAKLRVQCQAQGLERLPTPSQFQSSSREWTSPKAARQQRQTESAKLAKLHRGIEPRRRHQYKQHRRRMRWFSKAEQMLPSTEFSWYACKEVWSNLRESRRTRSSEWSWPMTNFLKKCQQQTNLRGPGCAQVLRIWNLIEALTNDILRLTIGDVERHVLIARWDSTLL